MHEIRGMRIAPNWTTAAGAVEGILAYLGVSLPRHAVMGLSGLAWHFCLGARDGVVALPSGPMDLDWDGAVAGYSRLGLRWERFGARLRPGDDWTDMREAAIEWSVAHLDAGHPIAGWDFHLHEFGVVHGYDRERRGFLVDDVLTGEQGPLAPWDAWPSQLGIIELHAPLGPSEVDPLDAIRGALEYALVCLAGDDGPRDGQPRGTAGLEAWAAALEGDTEVDRAGNAYTLAILQAARLDAADFVADIAAALPDLSAAAAPAERALRDQALALAPLLSLFPFPAGGHGNISSPGLRRAAAMAVRQAAGHERRAAEALRHVLELLSAG